METSQEALGTYRPNVDENGVWGKVAGIYYKIKGDSVLLEIDVPGCGRFKKDRTVVARGRGYKSFEGFMRRAGYGARVAAIEYAEVGIVMFFYDARPIIHRHDDAEAGGFGYAMNLTHSHLSEWGTSPFPWVGETVEQANERRSSGVKAFMDAISGGHPENITIIDAGDRVIGVDAEIDNV